MTTTTPLQDRRRAVARELARRYGVMSTENLDIFASILTEEKYPKGSLVLTEGQVCRKIYYVQRGLARQYYMKNGKELTEHLAFEGTTVMCIESLFKHQPSRLVIETLENSLLYGIPYDELCKMANGSAEFGRFLLSILRESLITSQVKADTLRFESTKERYARISAEHPEIIQRVPLNIVASYLQMSPETLSRARSAAATAHATEEDQ